MHAAIALAPSSASAPRSRAWPSVAGAERAAGRVKSYVQRAQTKLRAALAA